MKPCVFTLLFTVFKYNIYLLIVPNLFGLYTIVLVLYFNVYFVMNKNTNLFKILQLRFKITKNNKVEKYFILREIISRNIN